MGDFHRSVEIARFLPMSFSSHIYFPPQISCQTWAISPIPKRFLPITISPHIAMFRAMGDFHRSVEIARFLPMNFPQIAKQFAIPKTVTDFFCNVQNNGLWTCQVGSRNCTKKNRSEIATDSPANRQRRVKSGGMGGNHLYWGRGTGEGQPSREEPPNACVCTSSAQCSDSFKRHVRALKAELPKSLHKTPFFLLGGSALR